jgi:hypothetical protein
MKKYLFSIIFLLVSYVGFSQKGLSYQAVILDPNAIEVPGQDISGQPFVNGDVWMKFSIYNGSTLQFEEVQKTRTDAYGLVNLMIGSVSTASFNSLVWDSSQKTLQVQVSFNQGGSYLKVSEQKLTYSPYTLFAETAGKLGGILAISGGGTGATTVADARLNLGLDQVNNTSDAAKPVSTETKAALDLKANNVDVTTAMALKANTSDVNAALASKADTADVNAGLALKANTTDMTAALAAKADTGSIKSYVLTQVAAATIADADASTKGKIQLAGDLAGTAAAPAVPGLALKENSANKSTNVTTDGASDTKYPSVKSVKTYVDTQVAGATIADANATSKGKIQLAGDLAGTAAAPTVPGLALKENSANKSTNVSTDGASDSKYPSVKAVKSYVDAQLAAGIASATIADADASTKGKIQLAGDLGGTAASPTVPGLALKANATDLVSLTSDVNSNTASITTNASSIAGETTRATTAELVLTNSVAANTASITTNASSIAGETTRATTAELVLTNSVAANTASITANTSSITAETTRATAAELVLTNGVAANTASITANASSITAETTRATAAELVLTNGVAANTASITANIAAIDLKAPIASPTFTGTLTAPIYATTPQTLTDAATISWNPANGLNANVTLGGNRTLSFTTTPASGSYGTLVVTQDGTGGRTLTLPSGTHKVLGSATSTISLSATAGAKDILNFYYDGLTSTYYWNVGQGYGAASTFTANNIAGGAAGSIPYQTASGATSLLAKGSDGYILTLASGIPSWAAAPATGVTSVSMTTPTGLSVSGSPITSSGTLALSLTSGYAIPLSSSQTNWDAAYTNRITSASSPLSITSNAISLGTVPVSSGGTGATTLTGIIKGTGTSALTAAIAGTDYVAPNSAITGATKTKITYDANGLVTVGADATTADIAPSTDRNYVTDIKAVVLSNTTGTNTGDQTITLTGDVTGTGTGTFTSTIANSAVTYAKMQNVTAGKLLGSTNTSAAAPGEVTIGTGLSLTNGTLTASGTGGTVTNVNPITVTASGSTFTSTVTNATTTPAITLTIPLASVAGTTAGLLSNTDYATFNAKQDALIAGSGISIASNTISATGLTTSNLSSSAGIVNGQLANSAITLGSTSMSLGSINTTIAGLTSVTSTGFTGALTGNSSTATALATARSIYGNNFDGTAALSGVISTTFGGTGASSTSQNFVFAGPTSGAGAPSFRLLTSADVPAGSGNYIANGTTQQTSSNFNISGSGVVGTSLSAGSLSLTTALSVANGGTGLTSTPADGQIDIGNGSGFTRTTLTAGTAITITNTAGAITISAAVRPMTEQTTATSSHAVATATFTLTNTPLNAKVWMFINGVRTNNNAYSVSGATVSYTAANNNSYTIVVGDRIQFDYAY